MSRVLLSSKVSRVFLPGHRQMPCHRTHRSAMRDPLGDQLPCECWLVNSAFCQENAAFGEISLGSTVPRSEVFCPE